MNVLICGDREWTAQVPVQRLICGLLKGDVVIHGDARGADRMAGHIAETVGLTVLKFPAEWDKHGKAAGPIRNQRMLVEGNPDEVWALHDNIGVSKGTRDMCRRAKEAGVPVYVVSHY